MLTLASLSSKMSAMYVVVAFASSHFSLVKNASVPVSGFRAAWTRRIIILNPCCGKAL